MASKKGFMGIIVEWTETIVIAFILACIIKAFGIALFFIPSASMDPTLKIKDRLVVSSSHYGIQNPLYNLKKSQYLVVDLIPNPTYKKNLPFSEKKYLYQINNKPQRLDIVIFFPPEEPVGGSEQQFKDGIMRKVTYFRPPQRPGTRYIKRIIGLPGEVLEVKEGYIYIDGTKIDDSKLTMNRDEDNFGPIKIQANTYFMMGDNRGNSSDSRVWGFVPAENILGKALFRIWPVNRLGKL